MSLFSPKPMPISGTLIPFTEEDVKLALPSHLRASVSPQLVADLNSIAADPEMVEVIRENFVTYSIVLKEGKFKLEDYLTAVAYVSYKLMGYNNEEAYSRALPVRYQTLIAKGTPAKERSAYVSGYNKGKLVNLILERSLIPSWVLNQDLHQKAINVQADLMQNATSEKVRTDAANSLLTHLAKPKDTNLQINIGEIESSGMKEMRDMLAQLAKSQKEAIELGDVKTIDVASMRITKEPVNE